MKFREKSISKFYAFALAAVFAIALAGCGGGGGSATTEPDPPSMPDPAIAQRAAISTAIGTASTAVNAVDNDSTDAQVSAADTAIANARSAISAAANVPAEEKAANSGTVDTLATQLASAKTARMAAMEDEQKAADMAMMATAMKLHASIGDDPLASSGDEERTAAYSGTNDADITVTIGTAPQVLKEDKKATVAANHGWAGKKYAASGTGVDGTYEAVVYSNVGDPKEGDPFNKMYGDDLNETTGELTIDTTGEGVAGRVASSSFDQSAGKKEFKKGDNLERVIIAGSYHGVSGSYYCTPNSNLTCSATVAASGFTLAGGTWTFKPANAETKVTSMSDTSYASYGWWLHKSANGNTFTASAFVDDKGTDVEAASGITALRGTATYMGGAAGKYALYSSTGGTNDAGHFTAKATLEADFNANMITGTIDEFMGADGQSRNWSVELKKSGINDGGNILGAAGADNSAPMETVWMIDGTAADAAGAWSGALKNNGDDDVPEVVTGTFHSEYSTSGRMVGAFGANKQ